MAEQCSELEKALNTLVTEFHKACTDNSSSMNVEQFKGMLSAQMPSLDKASSSEQGMAEILQQMGVKDGEGISFKNFWSLIQSVATKQFSALSPENSAKCTCRLL
ncbi:protein S100-A1 protein4-like [Scleropages formosus]|uniref:Protein S100-A1 protein4-like n=1 Tax=Scleropages formosus TaxID=113540 RepID=A0A0P7V0C7_SCLFO|nr:protein S100-A1 protein4-like [Scleropages formosus]